ncbi:MAG: alpha/beta hydrolase family protein [Nitrospinota bacterium]
MRGILRLLIAAVLLAAIAGCSPRPGVSFLAALDILSDKENGYLSRIYPDVDRASLRFSARERAISADLYRLPGQGDSGERPGLLVIHGLAEMGKDDPHLIRFSRTMARAGFAVLVPDFPGMKSFRVRKTSVEAAAAAFDHLVSRVPRIRKKDSGILGISFGGGIGLLAAAQPEVRRKVAYVVSFGGYYDLPNVIRYYTTRRFAYGREQGVGNPAPRAKWRLISKNLDFLEEADDQRNFEILCRRKLRDESADVGDLTGKLTPAGRALYDVLANTEFSRFPALYERISPRMRGLLEDLSLSGKIRDVQADIILSHGIPDPLIPHTETLRLADALKGRPNLSVTLLRLFRHVDPKEGGTEPLGLLDRTKEGWKFFRLVDRIRTRAGL